MFFSIILSSDTYKIILYTLSQNICILKPSANSKMETNYIDNTLSFGSEALVNNFGEHWNTQKTNVHTGSSLSIYEPLILANKPVNNITTFTKFRQSNFTAFTKKEAAIIFLSNKQAKFFKLKHQNSSSTPNFNQGDQFGMGLTVFI